MKDLLDQLLSLDLNSYLDNYPIHKLFGIDLSEYGPVNRKKVYDVYQSVDPSNEIPFEVELDDLIRLHYLITSRKVTTILEFGVGKSTVVLTNALRANKQKYQDYVEKNLRRTDAFTCYSVDNNKRWLAQCSSDFGELVSDTHLHFSEVYLSEFNGRFCTYYENLPNICPDFIYLDAPDQFSPNGTIDGFSTRHPDRLPMAGDILRFEHFLLPGTLIVVDGRTANARFLKANLQRDWSYSWSPEFDQHFFELVEPPLGVYNQRQLQFCASKAN